ncbi:MAG: DUF2516 family protein [Actinomycetota bacterium]
MIFSNPAAVSALTWFFEVLALAALVMEAYALIDVLRRPAQAFVAAGKQTKPLWLAILIAATAIGLGTALAPGGLAAIGILSVAAFVASAVYLTDVRPRVREFRGGSSHQGPYGPW